ncbi:MAG TPA: response regulator transcription factor [Chloroflexota bacterium]|nr:response regulator transcription factor [Chloroflexota bacterium]
MAVPGAERQASQRPLVLVVDDDRTLRRLAESTLKTEFRVVSAGNGEEALRILFQHRPDVILLDVSMPVMDGWETCRRIRQLCETPVIMLTARDANEDVVRGLDAGADDYVIKPFHPEQLRARIRAVLRRQQRGASAGAGSGPDVLSFDEGRLVVDRVRRLAVVRGREVVLTSTEYRLLEQLALHAGQVLSHNQILEKVWGPEYVGESDYVKTYVAHLRRKLEQNPSVPVYLHARRGMGYYLDPYGRHQPGEAADAADAADGDEPAEGEAPE